MSCVVGVKSSLWDLRASGFLDLIRAKGWCYLSQVIWYVGFLGTVSLPSFYGCKTTREVTGSRFRSGTSLLHFRLPESQGCSLSIRQHGPPCCVQIVQIQSKALLTVQVICKFKEETIN